MRKYFFLDEKIESSGREMFRRREVGFFIGFKF
jgi:hypothetical protein